MTLDQIRKDLTEIEIHYKPAEYSAPQNQVYRVMVLLERVNAEEAKQLDLSDKERDWFNAHFD